MFKKSEHKRLAEGQYTPPKVSNVRTNLRKRKGKKAPADPKAAAAMQMLMGKRKAKGKKKKSAKKGGKNC